MKLPRACNIGVNTCIMLLKKATDWVANVIETCPGFILAQRPCFLEIVCIFSEDYWNPECLTILCFMKHAECKFPTITAQGSLNEENLWMLTSPRALSIHQANG